jgi:hypothetical protein
MPVASPFRANRAIGAMIFSVMGTIWITLWSIRSFGVQPLGLTVTTSGGLVIFLRALRVFQQHKRARVVQAETPEKRHADRIFNLVNAGQWIVILIVGNVLNNLGRGEWVIMAAMFIIGLHFLPLAKVFTYPPHTITGAALMLWAVGFPMLTSRGPAHPLGCLGAGLILWLSALYGLSVNEPQPRSDSSPSAVAPEHGPQA